MKFSLSFLLGLILVLQACKKEEITNTGIHGLNYYPLTLGKYVIYDVDSTVYTQLPKDTLYYKYRIKEKLADTYTDNEGRTAYRLERYSKVYNPLIPYDSMPWQIKEVWMVNAGNMHVQVLENNVRYTKLIFPVSTNTSWNGNASNTLGEKIYTYEYSDEPESINTLQLTTLKVLQNNFITSISHDVESEKYALGIGLIYKQKEHLLSQAVVQGVPVAQRIESGLIYKQTLRTYGYE